MMLIEPDKRTKRFAVPLSYATDTDEPFYVPDNVYLIGTMNTADRSLSLVDYALRRRFAFVPLEPRFDSPTFAKTLEKAGASAELIDKIQTRMTKVNSLIDKDIANLGKGYQIGHSFFVPQNGCQIDDAWLRDVVEHQILPLIDEYWVDDEEARKRAVNAVWGSDGE